KRGILLVQGTIASGVIPGTRLVSTRAEARTVKLAHQSRLQSDRRQGHPGRLREVLDNHRNPSNADVRGSNDFLQWCTKAVYPRAAHREAKIDAQNEEECFKCPLPKRQVTCSLII